MAGFSNDVVYGVNVNFTGLSGNAGKSAQVTADGQLLIGSTASPNIRVATLTAGTGIDITNGAGTITIGLTGSGVALQHLTGNTGGSLNPDGANNINTLGTGSITVAGVGSTLTTQLTGLTNHAVLIGAGTATITKVGPVASTGAVLMSNGAANDPGFSTATYPLTTTVNEILYSSATNTVTGLATAVNSALVTDASGVPSLGTSLLNDFTYTSATAGATRTLTISNTNNSNTASNALSQITVGGASAGDPFQTFTVTGATSWSQGIDNSVSDNFVIAASTALGTSNVMSATIGGIVNIPSNLDVGTSTPSFQYDLNVEKSTSGGQVVAQVRNSSNTASSEAVLSLSVAGTTALSPWISWVVDGGLAFGAGIRSNAILAIVPNSTPLSSTAGIQMDGTGRINLPIQPAFLAYQASEATNATGDGTVYVLGSTVDLTEIYDQNANFDPSTGIFTAPVTGRYHLSAQAVFNNIGVSSGYFIIITTSNRQYVSSDGFTGSTNNITEKISFDCDMDIADTATSSVTVGGTTKTVGVYGQATNVYTGFSGYMFA